MSSGDLARYESQLASHLALLSWVKASGASYGLPSDLSQLDDVQRETLEAVYPNPVRALDSPVDGKEADPFPSARPASTARQDATDDDGALQIDPPASLALPPLVIVLSPSAGLKKTTQNFLALAADLPKFKSKRSPHPELSYRSDAGRKVFRVEQGFVAQMGDVTRGDGSGGESICAWAFVDGVARTYCRAVLADRAHASTPSSQTAARSTTTRRASRRRSRRARSRWPIAARTVTRLRCVFTPAVRHAASRPLTSCAVAASRAPSSSSRSRRRRPSSPSSAASTLPSARSTRPSPRTARRSSGCRPWRTAREGRRRRFGSARAPSGTSEERSRARSVRRLQPFPCPSSSSVPDDDSASFCAQTERSQSAALRQGPQAGGGRSRRFQTDEVSRMLHYLSYSDDKVH